ncbi:hypothetical protein BO70DRAFT_44758 [Aspergillus heteromorphus CBS 117.55]|uniref:RNase III domain-containing protein n=1 Tax=Aspergillus heteromorphus CBS 117.55 TaxID=1448321 RepID=A0A317W201_9EURO|nr:uncharacterized protein BO70DRAFT_44758 [Aspergillus heteromorphus CBS 117.55]PWY80503.1 hypothetical protein BO70DRAFT_44758 [Aspergillus heteromorphus CBS 117.55]
MTPPNVLRSPAAATPLIEQIIRYKFKDRGLLARALLPAMVVHGRYLINGSQDLAHLGHSALKMILSQDGFHNNEGAGLTEYVILEEAGDSNLWWVGFTKELDRFIPKDRVPMSKKAIEEAVANMMKAIMGAVYVDSGYRLEKVANVIDALGIGWMEEDPDDSGTDEGSIIAV